MQQPETTGLPAKGTRDVIVGREHAQSVLRECLDSALAGRGRTVLVLGEPGIGKTALLRDAAESHQHSAVIYEWCREGVPFSPWPAVVRKVRGLLAEPEHAETDDLLNRCAVRSEDEDLFVALTEALLAAAARRPLLLLLDDLSNASAASLRFARHLSLQLWNSPLCLVLAALNTGADGDDDLRNALGDLTRVAHTVTLTGLEPGDCETLIEHRVGHRVPTNVVQHLHARSGGNPLFLEHAVQLWQHSGSLSIVPRQIEDTVLSRLRLLPPGPRAVLDTASVLGRQFSVELLHRVSDLPRAELTAHLSVLQHAHFLRTTGPATMTFVHAAVTELLYTSLPPQAAAQTHARTVVSSGDDAHGLGLTPTELAAHAESAGDQLDPAITHVLHTAAGRHCIHQMATEQALEHYRKAYECLPCRPAETVPTPC